MRLFRGENVDEFLEMSDTSASKDIKQLIITLTGLQHVGNMFPLRPRDTSDIGIGKFSDKRSIGVHAIQQLNAIDSQSAHSSFV